MRGPRKKASSGGFPKFVDHNVVPPFVPDKDVKEPALEQEEGDDVYMGRFNPLIDPCAVAIGAGYEGEVGALGLKRFCSATGAKIVTSTKLPAPKEDRKEFYSRTPMPSPTKKVKLRVDTGTFKGYLHLDVFENLPKKWSAFQRKQSENMSIQINQMLPTTVVSKDWGQPKGLMNVDVPNTGGILALCRCPCLTKGEDIVDVPGYGRCTKADEGFTRVLAYSEIQDKARLIKSKDNPFYKPRSEQDIIRRWLVQELNLGVIYVKHTTKASKFTVEAERRACTKVAHLIPAKKHPKMDNANLMSDDPAINVFDLELGEWRSFVPESIVEVRVRSRYYPLSAWQSSTGNPTKPTDYERKSQWHLENPVEQEAYRPPEAPDPRAELRKQARELIERAGKWKDSSPLVL